MLPGGPQLRRARKAASRRGLEVNLSINDWNQTCADLDHRCVYCGNGASGDASIDHFLPMAWGGGTTITNCVLSCRGCNQLKGERRPEIFLSHDPEKLARIQYYLARRQSGQGYYSFWAFLLPKGHRMDKEKMQSTPCKLNSGTELCIYNDDQNTVLQFRQPAAENDPLTTSVQVATRLTPSECLALAGTLLNYAAPKVEEKQSPTVAAAYPW